MFDGNSLVFDADGHAGLAAGAVCRRFRGVRYRTARQCLKRASRRPHCRPRRACAKPICSTRSCWACKDYARKSGFRDCVLGLSGGIDSALACYIAARAFGPEHVHGLAMPSRYSSEHSVDRRPQLWPKHLGVDFEVVPIDAMHRAYEATRSRRRRTWRRSRRDWPTRTCRPASAGRW